MRRGGGGGTRAGVALEETGAALGEMLRRALAERLAVQDARRVEALGLDGRRTGGDGDAFGDVDGIDRGRVGPVAVGREGDPQ